MLIGWMLSTAPPAAAREPCPRSSEEGARSRSDVLQAAERALEGYHARDVRVVDAARCDIERGLPRLKEELGPADVGRIHLAYAVAAQITGEPPEAVSAYLAAARGADSYLDGAFEGLVGEGDPLVPLYRALVEAPPRGGFLPKKLPPAWAGEVLVNGKREAFTRADPYVLQLSGQNASLDRSFYVEAGADPPRYVRKRPVIAGLMAGSAALSVTGLAVGMAFAAEGEQVLGARGERLASGKSVDGEDLISQRDALEAEVAGIELRNNIAMGAAAGFGLITLGLGVWYVTTF